MFFGLLARSYKSILDRIKELGFNMVRLPFSNEALLPSCVPRSIDFRLNGDLYGLNCLQCLDKIIQYIGEIGLRAVLDRHSAKAGNFFNETLWSINPIYNEKRFIDDWVMLAKRYAGIYVLKITYRLLFHSICCCFFPPRYLRYRCRSVE